MRAQDEDIAHLTRVDILMSRVRVSQFRAQGLRYRVLGLGGCRVLGLGYRI
jgi:hypothetical protein